MKRNTALAYFKPPAKSDPYAEVALAQERKAVEQVCAERNWTPEWYERGGPGWEALTAQLDRLDVVAVVAYSLTRFTRRLRVLASFLSECQQRGIDVVTVDEGLDTSNGGWEQMSQVLAIPSTPAEFPGTYLRRSSPST